jgi:hypothetical protein
MNALYLSDIVSFTLRDSWLGNTGLSPLYRPNAFFKSILAISLSFSGSISGCAVMGMVWNNTQLSKICFLYCFHNIEQTATVRNNAVKPFMGGH